MSADRPALRAGFRAQSQSCARCERDSGMLALIESAEASGCWTAVFDALSLKLRTGCAKVSEGMDTPEGLAMLEDHCAAMAEQAMKRRNLPDPERAMRAAVHRGAKAGGVRFCTEAMALVLQMAGFEEILPDAVNALAAVWERLARAREERKEDESWRGRR